MWSGIVHHKSRPQNTCLTHRWRQYSLVMLCRAIPLWSCWGHALTVDGDPGALTGYGSKGTVTWGHMKGFGYYHPLHFYSLNFDVGVIRDTLRAPDTRSSFHRNMEPFWRLWHHGRGFYCWNPGQNVLEKSFLIIFDLKKLPWNQSLREKRVPKWCP